MNDNDPATPARKFFTEYAINVGPRADRALMCAQCTRLFEVADGDACPWCASTSISPFKPNAFTIKTLAGPQNPSSTFLALAGRRDEAPIDECPRCDDNSCEDCFPCVEPGVV